MNENVLEIKIKNLTYIVLIGFIVITILIVGLYFKDGIPTKSSTNNTNTGTNNNQSTTNYDVSKMNAVNVEKALALFNEKGTHILYIGRSDCSSCISTVPVLNQVQEELKYTTNYFDLNQTKNWQTEMKELADKFTVAATVKDEESTIGKLFIEHGYTPTIIIIKDGKVVDGFIGYRDHDTLKELVSKYL